MSAAAIDRLPHREPFRFLSELTELSTGIAGAGLWRITGGEAFFTGHFPGDPVVPGVLIAEALAQLSGLVGLHVEPGPIGENAAGPTTRGGPAVRGGRLVHVDLRFDRGVKPPATIELRSALARELGPLRMFDVAASVDGQRVARGTLTLAQV
ncbi:MAG: 3-hydroxyacyl-ACP dehydratase FabZ family protein [Phycisphaerales bacterium]